MGPNGYWTDEEVELLKYLILEGWTNQEIASVLMRSKQSIRSKKNKIAVKSPPWVNLLARRKNQIQMRNPFNKCQEKITKIGAPA